MCTRSRQLEAPSDLNVFDGKDAFVWLPTGSGKFICLPFMFDTGKKLVKDNSLVVVVHHYLQQLSPTSGAHVCTSDKRVEADRRLTALERRGGLNS